MAAKRGRQPGVILTDEHRLKIKNSNILSCLIEHAQGAREMTASQVQAGIALLRKVLPDLSAVELSGVVQLEHEDRVAQMERDAAEYTEAGGAVPPTIN